MKIVLTSFKFLRFAYLLAAIKSAIVVIPATAIVSYVLWMGNLDVNRELFYISVLGVHCSQLAMFTLWSLIFKKASFFFDKDFSNLEKRNISKKLFWLFGLNTILTLFISIKNASPNDDTSPLSTLKLLQTLSSEKSQNFLNQITSFVVPVQFGYLYLVAGILFYKLSSEKPIS